MGFFEVPLSPTIALVCHQDEALTGVVNRYSEALEEAHPQQLVC
jgi:hypothetical protein